MGNLVSFPKSDQGHHRRRRLRLPPISGGTLADALRPCDSPGGKGTPKNVVIVMDGLKEFSMKPLVWALQYLIQSCCTVTILCIMPYLNIPLSTKIGLDVGTIDLEELSILREKLDWKGNDVKYLKLQAISDLCKKYGVAARIKVAMGHPLRLLVVEQITSLHATWVVFDSACGDIHQRKTREYFMKRIPYNMVMIHGNGDVDMFQGPSMINNDENTPGRESPESLLSTPRVIIHEQLMREMLGVRT